MQEHHRPGLRHQEKSASTVRHVQPAEEPTESAARRAPVLKEAPVEGERRVRDWGTRESLDYWRSSGTPGQVNASTVFFI